MTITYAGYTGDGCNVLDTLWAWARSVAGGDSERRDANLNTWQDHYGNYPGDTMDDAAMSWYVDWCDISVDYWAMDDERRQDDNYPADDYEAQLSYMRARIAAR